MYVALMGARPPRRGKQDAVRTGGPIDEESVYAYSKFLFHHSIAAMTTVQITLPDDLAKTAQAAGLLESEVIQGMLRQHLQSQALDDLRQVWRAMPSQQLSPEIEAEITDAVRQCRAEMQAEPGAG